MLVVLVDILLSGLGVDILGLKGLFYSTINGLGVDILGLKGLFYSTISDTV